MLIIERKIDEGIWIGDDVRVVIVSARGGTVKLGIEADLSVKVLRDEHVAAIRRERKDRIRGGRPS